MTCEKLLISERQEAHKFLVKGILAIDLCRSIKQIFVISGDGFFDKFIMRDLGLLNARFIAYFFYLFDDKNLKEKFRNRTFKTLKPYLLRVANSIDLDQFQTVHEDAVNTLNDLKIDSFVDWELLKNLKSFIMKRKYMYSLKLSKYWVNVDIEDQIQLNRIIQV